MKAEDAAFVLKRVGITEAFAEMLRAMASKLDETNEEISGFYESWLREIERKAEDTK